MLFWWILCMSELKWDEQEFPSSSSSSSSIRYSTHGCVTPSFCWPIKNKEVFFLWNQNRISSISNRIVWLVGNFFLVMEWREVEWSEVAVQLPFFFSSKSHGILHTTTSSLSWMWLKWLAIVCLSEKVCNGVQYQRPGRLRGPPLSDFISFHFHHPANRFEWSASHYQTLLQKRWGWGWGC